MHIINLAVFGALASQVVAVPVSTDHVVHERRDRVPDAWAKRDRLDAAVTLPVRIGMTQRNLDNGYDMLLDV